MISKKTVEKGRLLALAYIRAKAGDAKSAGEMMVAACEGTELDPIMHGVAEGLGFEDPEEDEDAEVAEPDEVSADADEEEEEEVDAPSDVDDEVEEDDEAEADEAEADEDADDQKVEIPASVARLANMKY